MKIVVCLKGGSSIVVDLSKQIFILSQGKIHILNSNDERSAWFVDKVDEFILPCDILEELKIE